MQLKVLSDLISDSALRRKLDWMTSSGPFQSELPFKNAKTKKWLQKFQFFSLILLSVC